MRTLRASIALFLVAVLMVGVVGIVNVEQVFAAKKAKPKDKVIVIDAGHQVKGNSKLEPIGPGAKTKKAKVTSGTQGVGTKVPEYQVNLDVALKLEKILTDKGYTVVMIRTENDIDLSNAERAKIANDEKADAFVRIHCNGSTNKEAKGALTMCQTKKNSYIGKSMYKKSRALSDYVVDSLCKETKATNKGVIETDSMSGINWCKVPVTIVEMGFMANAEEDKLLTSDTYQDKLAKGIAAGVVEYLENEGK